MDHVQDAASKSCGLKVVCVCHGGNRRTRWWTPAVREAVKLKKEAFRAWLSRGSPEGADRYQGAQRAAALEPAEAKTQTWEEF